MKRPIPPLPASGVLSLGTLMIIVVSFGVYYYVIAENRADYLTRRNLRQLNVVSVKTQSMLSGFATAANSWIERISDSSRYRTFFDRLVITPLKAATIPPPRFKGKRARGSPKVILLKASDNELWVTYTDTVALRGDSAVSKEFWKRVELPLPDDPAALSDLFDMILLVDGRGTVLVSDDVSHQSIAVVALDSLPGANGTGISLRQAAEATGVSSFGIAGKTYKAFYQPLPIPNELQTDHPPWVLVGLTGMDRFRSESLRLSYDSIILFVFLILIAVLSWPLLKVGFMGVKEELRPIEVFFLLLSALLGSALITALVADYFCIQQSFTAELDESLRALADGVERHLHRELDRAFVQLRDFNAAANDPSAAHDSLRAGILMDRGTPFYPVAYPGADALYEIGPDGRQLTKWMVEKKTSPLINVGGRSYFLKVMHGPLWRTAVDSADSIDFCLEPHLSLTTGEFETTLAVPALVKTGKQGVAGMSTDPASLVDAVVMAGFAFCVIDQNGNVLYHADPSRNLSEDFFEECDQDADLLTAVQRRTTCLTKVNYWGEMYEVYVKPVRDLPWFVVALRQDNLAKATNLAIVTVSMLLFLAYAIVLLILFAVSYFRGGAQVEWIWPVPVHRESYFALMFFFIVLSFVFLLMRTLDASADHVLIVTCLLPHLAVGVSYLALRSGVTRPHGRDRSVTVTAGVTAVITALLVALSLQAPQVWVPWLICSASVLAGLALTFSGKLAAFLRHHWLRALLSLLIIYIVTTVTPFTMLSGIWAGGGLVGLAAGIAVALAAWPLSWKLRDVPLLGYRNAYTISAAAFLWFAAVQPSLNFYKIACDAELELLVRHEQLCLGNALESRAGRIRTKFESIPAPGPVLARALSDTTGLYYSTFLGTAMPGVDTGAHVGAISFTDSAIVPLLTPRYDDVASHTKGVMSSSSADGLWRWLRSGPDSLLLFRKTSIESYGGRRAVASISTVLPGYLRELELLPLPMWIVLVCAMGALLAWLYCLVRFIVKSVFLVDALEGPSSWTPEHILAHDGRNVLVVGRPTARRHELLADRRASLIDMRKLRDPAQWNARVPASRDRVVVIDHFDFMIDEPRLNNAKLEFLEQLVYTDRRKTVLLSSMDPMIALGRDLPGTPGPGRAEAVERHDSDRWAQMLSPFVRTSLSAGGGDPEFAKNVMEKIPVALTERGAGRRVEALQRIVLEECGDDPQLQEIALMVLEEIGDEQYASLTRDEFLRCLLDGARPYYHHIWRTCTRDQRRVLIHLARNGYVNAKNRPYVEQLLRVGLVVRNPALRPMNRTFRSFILEVRRPADTAMTADEARGSTWGMLRLPLTLVVVGVAVFLFATQRDVMDSTTALVTGAAGVLPALLRLLGVFKTDDASTAKDG